MIAPLRQTDPETTRTRQRLREAHDLVTSTLLQRESADPGQRVPTWQAWAFAAWVAVVTGIYTLYMLGFV